MLSAPERRARARIGGLARSARYDPREVTAAANAANERRWLDLADPDGSLPGPERERRAQALKREHFARLGFQSVKARRRKAGIDSLGLSERLERALRVDGIDTIAELSKRPSDELATVYGEDAAREIRAALWRWENGDPEVAG